MTEDYEDVREEMPPPPFQEDLISFGDLREYGTPVQLGALYGALAAARGEFKPVKKTADVSYMSKKGYKVEYSYAPLVNLTECTTGALAANGLIIMQPFTMDGGVGYIRTILAHKDGGRLVSVVRFTPTGDTKELGGQTTYLARYAYQRLLVIDGDNDADAHGAETPSGAGSPPINRPSARAPQKNPPQPPPKRAEEPPKEENKAEPVPPPDERHSQKQGLAIRDLFIKLGYKKSACLQVTREVCGVEPDDVTVEQADKLIAHLEGLANG